MGVLNHTTKPKARSNIPLQHLIYRFIMNTRLNKSPPASWPQPLSLGVGPALGHTHGKQARNYTMGRALPPLA